MKDGSDEPPRPVYLVQGTHTYECLVGFPVTATDEDRKRNLDAGKCTNCFCLKFKKYPNHLVDKCPFTQRDPERNPWPATHIPVPTQDGRLLRPSDPETIKAFLAARKTLLADPSLKARSGSSSSSSGSEDEYPDIPDIP